MAGGATSSRRATSVQSQRDELNREIARLFEQTPKNLHRTLVNGLANHHTQTTDRRSLLGLPAELRQRIWKFALLEEDDIEISATLPVPPGLLSVCKDIRDETITIYYGLNNFSILMFDYDAQSILPSYGVQDKYARLAFEMGIRQEHHVTNRSFDFVGMPNWQNFEEWCRLVHKCDMDGLGISDDSDNRDDISVAAIHGAVMSMAQRPWNEVKQVLVGFHVVMVLQDIRWAA